MAQRTGHEESIRLYLIGELSAEESKHVEERLLLDDDFYEQLLIVETELVDEYVRGTLSAPEREKLEKHFLAAPERRQELKFAAALKTYVAAQDFSHNISQTATKDKRHPWLRSLLASLSGRNHVAGFAMATVALAVVLIGLWLVLRSQRTQRPSTQVARQAAPSEQTPVPQEPPPPTLTPSVEPTNQAPARKPEQATERQGGEKPEQPPRAIVAVALTPGLLRDGGETKKLEIPSGERDIVRLQMELNADDYRAYRADLLTAEGARVKTFGGLRARREASGRIVTFDIPARLLARGDYQIKLAGLLAGGEAENVGRYYFRALKK